MQPMLTAYSHTVMCMCVCGGGGSYGGGRRETPQLEQLPALRQTKRRKLTPSNTTLEYRAEVGVNPLVGEIQTSPCKASVSVYIANIDYLNS